MKKRLEFLLSLVDHDGDECVEWPFALYSNGYGQMSYGGRKMTASHAMCLIAHGEPPPGKSQAAHKCGWRACVNPNHVRWADGLENYLDKIEQGRVPEYAFAGEKNNRAKITREQAMTIRSRALSGERYADIAKDFGIDRKSVSDIKRGKSWGAIDATAEAA